MQVQTPFLPLPVEVDRSGPYRVRRCGHAVLISGECGINAVSFRFDHAEILAKNGLEVSADLLERVPVFSTTTLADTPEDIKLCDDIAAFLNQ